VIGVVLAVVIPAAVLELCAGEARLAAGDVGGAVRVAPLLIATSSPPLPLGFDLCPWLRTRPRSASSPRWPWHVMGWWWHWPLPRRSATCGEALARSGARPYPLLCSDAAGRAAAGGLALVIAVADPLRRRTRPYPPLRAASYSCGARIGGRALRHVRRSAQRPAPTRRLNSSAKGVWQGPVGRDRPVQLGSERRVGMRSPAQLRSWLAATLQGLPARRATDRDIPSEADGVTGRALRSARTPRRGRRDSGAARACRRYRHADPAAIYRDQRRSARAMRFYTAIVDRHSGAWAPTKQPRAACRTAFEGLAENARNDHRPATPRQHSTAASRVAAECRVFPPPARPALSRRRAHRPRVETWDRRPPRSRDLRGPGG